MLETPQLIGKSFDFKEKDLILKNNLFYSDAHSYPAYFLKPINKGICVGILKQKHQPDTLIIAPPGYFFSDLDRERILKNIALNDDCFFIKNQNVKNVFSSIAFIIKQEKKLLLQYQNQGPYKGLFDLPKIPFYHFSSINPFIDLMQFKLHTTLNNITFQNNLEILYPYQNGLLQHKMFLFSACCNKIPQNAILMNTKDINLNNATPQAVIASGKELCLSVDERGQEIGVHLRKERPKGAYGLIGATLILTNENKLVLQKASLRKKNYPLKWTYSSAGHINAGESILSGTLRELREEMGVSANIESYIGSTQAFKNGALNNYHQVFLVHHNGPFYPDKKEAADIGIFSISELKKMIATHPEDFRDVFFNVFYQFLKLVPKKIAIQSTDYVQEK